MRCILKTSSPRCGLQNRRMRPERPAADIGAGCIRARVARLLEYAARVPIHVQQGCQRAARRPDREILKKRVLEVRNAAKLCENEGILGLEPVPEAAPHQATVGGPRGAEHHVVLSVEEVCRVAW